MAFLATLVTASGLAAALFGGLVPADVGLVDALFAALAGSVGLMVMTTSAMDA